jgi:D-alanyl-D-alanine carboxypeptidase (penicillin-binding protein 5/6)
MITKKNQSVKKFSALVAVLFGGALLSLGFQGILSAIGPSKNLEASLTEGTPTEIHSSTDPFQNIALEARAAYVFDLATKKVIFARNENEELPLASVTKIMTALLAREHASKKTVVTITEDDLKAEGDSGLRAGESFLLGNLLDVMLLVSSNDAAHAVARFIGSSKEQKISSDDARLHFVRLMNERAKAFGFTTMEFFNESGLDVNETKNGGYSSAREIALLMTKLWEKYPETLEITVRKNARIYSEDKFAHILPNTNEGIAHIPGLLASKTGYTSLAGGNLAIIFDRGVGSPIVAVVLGSTYKGRFDDMEKLTTMILKTLE